MKKFTVIVPAEIRRIEGMTESKALTLSTLCMKWLLVGKPLKNGDGLIKRIQDLNSLAEAGIVVESEGMWYPTRQIVQLFIYGTIRSIAGTEDVDNLESEKKLTRVAVFEFAHLPDMRMPAHDTPATGAHTLASSPLSSSPLGSPPLASPSLISLPSPTSPHQQFSPSSPSETQIKNNLDTCARENQTNSYSLSDFKVPKKPRNTTPVEEGIPFLRLLPERLKSNPAFLDAWKKWIEYRRKEKGKPVTELAASRTIERMENRSIAEILEGISVGMANQYIGLHPQRTFRCSETDMNSEELKEAVLTTLPETEGDQAAVLELVSCHLHSVVQEISAVPDAQSLNASIRPAGEFVKWILTLPVPKEGQTARHIQVERAGKMFMEPNYAYVRNLRKEYSAAPGIRLLFEEYRKWLVNRFRGQKQALMPGSLVPSRTLFTQFLLDYQRRLRVSFTTGKDMI